jgi:hypothetical protein
MAAAGCAAVFLYLPVRHAAQPPLDFVRDYFPQIDLSSFKGWTWMIRGGMFDSLFFSVPPREIGRHLLRLAAQLIANYGVVVALLSLLGMVSGWAGSRDRRHFTIACLLLFACHSGFYLAYGALDTDWMYSVSYLIWVLLAALGLGALDDRMRSWTEWGGRWILPALTALLLARLAWFNYPYLDLSRDTSARDTGERIMAAMGPNALFIGMWEHTPILEYLQMVEGRRKDVRLVNGVFIGPLGAQQLARDMHAARRPVYTTFTNLFDRGFAIAYVPEGLCYEVTPRAEAGCERSAGPQ